MNLEHGLASRPPRQYHFSHQPTEVSPDDPPPYDSFAEDPSSLPAPLTPESQAPPQSHRLGFGKISYDTLIGIEPQDSSLKGSESIGQTAPEDDESDDPLIPRRRFSRLPLLDDELERAGAQDHSVGESHHLGQGLTITVAEVDPISEDPPTPSRQRSRPRFRMPEVIDSSDDSSGESEPEGPLMCDDSDEQSEDCGTESESDSPSEEISIGSPRARVEAQSYFLQPVNPEDMDPGFWDRYEESIEEVQAAEARVSPGFMTRSIHHFRRFVDSQNSGSEQNTSFDEEDDKDDSDDDDGKEEEKEEDKTKALASIETPEQNLGIPPEYLTWWNSFNPMLVSDTRSSAHRPKFKTDLSEDDRQGFSRLIRTLSGSHTPATEERKARRIKYGSHNQLYKSPSTSPKPPKRVSFLDEGQLPTPPTLEQLHRQGLEIDRDPTPSELSDSYERRKSWSRAEGNNNGKSCEQSDHEDSNDEESNDEDSEGQNEKDEDDDSNKDGNPGGDNDPSAPSSSSNEPSSRNNESSNEGEGRNKQAATSHATSPEQDSPLLCDRHKCYTTEPPLLDFEVCGNGSIEVSEQGTKKISSPNDPMVQQMSADALPEVSLTLAQPFPLKPILHLRKLGPDIRSSAPPSEYCTGKFLTPPEPGSVTPKHHKQHSTFLNTRHMHLTSFLMDTIDTSLIPTLDLYPEVAVPSSPQRLDSLASIMKNFQHPEKPEQFFAAQSISFARVLTPASPATSVPEGLRSTKPQLGEPTRFPAQFLSNLEETRSMGARDKTGGLRATAAEFMPLLSISYTTLLKGSRKTNTQPEDLGPFIDTWSIDRRPETIMPPPSENQWMPTNWICQSCGFTDHRQRAIYRRCSFHEAPKDRTTNTIFQYNQGLWTCSWCSNSSFRYKTVCRFCSLSAGPANSSIGPVCGSKIPRKTGTQLKRRRRNWQCSSCKFYNFRQRTVCRSCHSPAVPSGAHKSPTGCRNGNTWPGKPRKVPPPYPTQPRPSWAPSALVASIPEGPPQKGTLQQD